MPPSGRDHDTGVEMETLGPRAATREKNQENPYIDTKSGGKLQQKYYFGRRQLVLYLQLLSLIYVHIYIMYCQYDQPTGRYL